MANYVIVCGGAGRGSSMFSMQATLMDWDNSIPELVLILKDCTHSPYSFKRPRNHTCPRSEINRKQHNTGRHKRGSKSDGKYAPES
jgi:hypothetical protein